MSTQAVASKSFYGFRETGMVNKYQSCALEIVTGCQLDCFNCYLDKTRQGRGNGKNPMDSDFVYGVIKQARELGFFEIVFIGGEPTLHNQLPQFVEMTLGLGLSPIVCTNGIRLSDAQYCSKVALPGTTIVIHGLLPMPWHTMDSHVSYRQYTERLRESYLNLDRIRQKGVTVVAESTVITTFYDHLLEFHGWCREQGITPFVEVNRRGNNGKCSDISCSPEKVLELFQAMQGYDTENGYPADLLLVPPAYGQRCTMSVTGVHIKNFGQGDYGGVYSCCAQTIRHGDLKEQSLAEILKSPGMGVFKEQDNWIAGPCAECEHYAECRGGCRGEAALAFGCSRASCPVCWHIPEEVRNDSRVMMPPSCDGCPLEGHPDCHPKQG